MSTPKPLACALAALLLAVACSRNEPRAAAVKSSAAPVSQAPESRPPTAASPDPGPDPASRAPSDSPALAQPEASPPPATPSAAVSVDGHPWDESSGITVRAADLWLGFMVEVESPLAGKLTIQVARGVTQGEHLAGADISAVVLVRGKETWRKQADAAAADVRSWQEGGSQPVVSLDWTATLRREGGGGKLMHVEAHVTNVPVAVHEAIPKLGVEKLGP